MAYYMVQRLALFVPTLVLVSSLVFAIMRFLPGDPAIAMLRPLPGGWERSG